MTPVCGHVPALGRVFEGDELISLFSVSSMCLNIVTFSSRRTVEPSVVFWPQFTMQAGAEHDDNSPWGKWTERRRCWCNTLVTQEICVVTGMHDTKIHTAA